jgi:hypothetical protein
MLLALPCVLTFSGCGSPGGSGGSAVAHVQEPVPAGAARFYLVRKSVSAPSSWDYAPKLNGVPFGRLGAGTFLSADLPPGTHTIRVESRHIDLTREVTLKAGQVAAYMFDAEKMKITEIPGSQRAAVLKSHSLSRDNYYEQRVAETENDGASK